MPPSGMLIVPGVRAEVTFYKGLLDKLGLQFDALQMGKYKGAAEPLTRNEMSKPLAREPRRHGRRHLRADLVATIAADRHLKDYQVKTLLDQGLFTAAAAKKAGLIDEVLYADQFEDVAGQAAQGRQDRRRHQLQEEADRHRFLRHLGGMMKLIELFIGGKPSEEGGQEAEDRRGLRRRADRRGQERRATCSASRPSARPRMVAALRKAADDPKVVAIVLRIDSPGGSATASDLIWRETVRMKKPMIASMGDVAGSGGYYIAMGAKKIVADPGTLDRLDRRDRRQAGHPRAVRQARPERPRSSAAASQQRLALVEPALHARRAEGLDRAAGRRPTSSSSARRPQGRKMTYGKLEELAQGRVYTGRMAKNLGLVDELGTLAGRRGRGEEGRRPEGRRRGRSADPAASPRRSSSSFSAIPR